MVIMRMLMITIPHQDSQFLLHFEEETHTHLCDPSQQQCEEMFFQTIRKLKSKTQVIKYEQISTTKYFNPVLFIHLQANFHKELHSIKMTIQTSQC